MRLSMKHITRMAAMGLVVVSVSTTGCKTGWKMPGKDMFSWGKKPSESTLASQPQLNFPSSPAQSHTPAPINNSAGGLASSPTRGPSNQLTGYTNPNGATSAATANNYQIGPYQTGASPQNAYAQQGGSGSAANPYAPNGGIPAVQTYGGAQGYNQRVSGASGSAGLANNASPSMPNGYNPGASSGYAPAGTNAYAANGAGAQPTAGYASNPSQGYSAPPAGGLPSLGTNPTTPAYAANQGYAANPGNGVAPAGAYRPGSTARPAAGFDATSGAAGGGYATTPTNPGYATPSYSPSNTSGGLPSLAPAPAAPMMATPGASSGYASPMVR